MNQAKYYLKFLQDNRMPAHGGKGQWPEPGVWTEEIEPIPCKQGWHLCRKQDIFRWMHETLWVVEVDGDVVPHTKENDKVVARRARLVRQVEEWCPRNQRLWAADCAEHVLHHWESKYPQDNRPRNAIETTRRYARGEATRQELDAARHAADYACYAARSAAWSAAWSAARSAAWSAAWSAALAAAASAIAWTAAESAAESAARSAADAAARLAAEAAAESSTERNWQIKHLFESYLKLNPTDFH